MVGHDHQCREPGLAGRCRHIGFPRRRSPCPIDRAPRKDRHGGCTRRAAARHTASRRSRSRCFRSAAHPQRRARNTREKVKPPQHPRTALRPPIWGVDPDNPATVRGRTDGTVVVPRPTGPICRLRPVELHDVEFLRANDDRVIKSRSPSPARSRCRTKPRTSSTGTRKS